jgi:hypothetical protein
MLHKPKVFSSSVTPRDDQINQGGLMSLRHFLEGCSTVSNQGDKVQSTLSATLDNDAQAGKWKLNLWQVDGFHMVERSLDELLSL